ncbi:helix-turn-helix transcriptional regulator [Isoptericola dokdonensis]|uniref:Helix-turn-helix domain protein n=1 Tax=Isoptericola dokdonensis DS-3 TaxID=1300344 RepID=A0A168F3C8_9MICO|nr:helix-turn-helix domain-containing protein [Isoptericola dokdonensis]ANC30841.1 Helix-turn-helix domain protein [Isoptericola dokdonensis DS-3]
MSDPTTPARLQYVSIPAAARMFGRSEQTIRNWLHRGYLTPYRAPGERGVRVNVQQVRDMLRSQPPSRVHRARRITHAAKPLPASAR